MRLENRVYNFTVNFYHQKKYIAAFIRTRSYLYNMASQENGSLSEARDMTSANHRRDDETAVRNDVTSTLARADVADDVDHPFKHSNETADLRLIVEGRPLYVSRILLSLISPVLKR